MKRRILMTIEKIKTIDILRGRRQAITIRFDNENLMKLPCCCRYDPYLCRKGGNQVMVVSKIERKNKDGSWILYPSVAWLEGEGIEGEDLFFSRVLIKKTGEKGFDIMSSGKGAPDIKLLQAARKAGICVFQG
jgi:hypothetical protein